MAESPPQKVKLILLGGSTSGKTCFAMRFLRNEFIFQSSATVGVEFYFKNLTVDNQIVRCEIWDPSGPKRFRQMLPVYSRNSDGGLAIYDLTQRETFDEVVEWIREFRQYTICDQPAVLVGNKSDLVEQRRVTYEESMDLVQQLNIPYIETSAHNGKNVEEAFIILIKNILKKKEKMLKSVTNVSSKEISK